MATKSEYTSNGKLSLSDGSQLLISHIGHMSLPTSQSLKLKNILLVPSITKNLISISKFTLENDVIVEFDSTCYYIKDKKLKVVLLQGMLKNGLYQLLLPSCGKLSQKSSYNLNLVSPQQLHCAQQQQPESSSAHTTRHNTNNTSNTFCNTQSLMNLWHGRLGHPNKVILNKVLSHLGISVPTSVVLQFCDACQYGKLHQISLSSIPLHTKEPFQVVYFDVWGPSPLLSMKGYRYYISFVDDLTRYTWIFPLRLKSEAIVMFQHFNKMVKR